MQGGPGHSSGVPVVSDLDLSLTTSSQKIAEACHQCHVYGIGHDKC